MTASRATEYYRRARYLLRTYPFESALGFLALGVIGYSRGFLVPSTGNSKLLTASLVFMILSIAVASFGLKRQGVGVERFFLSLAAMVSGTWIFEFLYHFAFPGSWDLDKILSQATSFNVNITPTQFPLLWGSILIVLPFGGLRYMRMNPVAVLVIFTTLVVFGLWFFTGYPQFAHPENWPTRFDRIPLIPRSLRGTHSSVIVFWGYLFNSLAKIGVLVPATLFLKGKAKPGDRAPTQKEIDPSAPDSGRTVATRSEPGAA